MQTNSVKHSLFLAANISASSQEIPCIFGNPEVHFGRHNSLPPVHMTNQNNPYHAPQKLYIFWCSIILCRGIPDTDSSAAAATTSTSTTTTTTALMLLLLVLLTLRQFFFKFLFRRCMCYT
jgi:hypothetical protein